MADLAFRVQHVIKTEIDVTEAQLSRNNIDMLTGIASFEDATHVKVTNARGTQTYEAKNIIIATGTKPADSPKVPINGRTHHQQRSDSGAAEPAQVADRGRRRRHRRGVHLHVRGARGARHADREAAQAAGVCRPGNRRGAQLPSARQPRDHAPERRSGERRRAARLHRRRQSGKQEEISGDALLYAVGRHGNVDELNLGAVGIEPDSRGRIPVDKDFRTKVPNIFAVGDVIGFPSLASVSMEQGRIAAARAFGNESLVSNPSYYPYGIYTIPEISFIGKTEEQLTDEDVPYEVGVAYYREIARGQIRGDTTGRLKFIFHRETRHLLGVHIIGEGASELLHIGQAVMALGGTLDYFMDTVFNYPTLAECYKAAAFNGINRLARAAD